MQIIASRTFSIARRIPVVDAGTGSIFPVDSAFVFLWNAEMRTRPKLGKKGWKNGNPRVPGTIYELPVPLKVSEQTIEHDLRG